MRSTRAATKCAQSGISLQRLADQKAAEAKENLDAELAEILAEARHLRLRPSGEIEMVAE